MLEKEIERKTCEYAKEKGFLHYKFTSPGHLGVPDRLFVGIGGRVFFIEFKREGGTPTPSQQREAERLTEHGCIVYLADSVEVGRRIIDMEFEILEQMQVVYRLNELFEKASEGDNSSGTVH